MIKGDVIDIGCGDFPVTENCDKFDVGDGDANYISRYVKKKYDVVFSSHCLEHMWNPYRTIKDWFSLVKDGGLLIVTIPDEDLYEQGVFPSRYNRDHKWTFTINKTDSLCKNSVNLSDLAKLLDGDVVMMKTQDDGYNHELKNVDQTAKFNAMAQNILIMKKTNMNKNVIFTVISQRDAKKASNMINSFLCYNKGWDAVIYTIGEFDTFGVKHENISMTSPINMRDDFERCECIRFLMAGTLLKSYDKVLYCDSDIMFFDKVPDYKKPICLTRHILDTKTVDKLSLHANRFLDSGFVNIGFMLFNKHDDSLAFCDAIFDMASKRMPCSADRRGRIRLQPAVSSIPYLNLDYMFIDHPGINTAYWRLDGDVTITQDGEKFFANGKPLVCFHFSGYVGDNRLCRFNRRDIDSYGDAVKNLLCKYIEALKK